MMTFMLLSLKIISNLSITEKFKQQANATFPPELVDTLKEELQRGELSEPNRAWLAQCGLTPDQIQNQMEAEYTPQRNMTPGVMCSVSIIRTVCNSLSACRGSSTMRRRGCIITGIVMMIRCREGICDAEDFDESDNQNAANLPVPGCSRGTSATAQRPDFSRAIPNASAINLPPMGQRRVSVLASAGLSTNNGEQLISFYSFSSQSIKNCVKAVAGSGCRRRWG
jgi:hypothetical protein